MRFDLDRLGLQPFFGRIELPLHAAVGFNELRDGRDHGRIVVVVTGEHGVDLFDAFRVLIDVGRDAPRQVLQLCQRVAGEMGLGLSQWARGGTSAQPHDQARGCHAAARRQ